LSIASESSDSVGLCLDTQCTRPCSRLNDKGVTECVHSIKQYFHAIRAVCLSPSSITPTLRQSRGLVTDFVANILTCRDGLCRRLSPKLYGFMICHCLCPRGEVSVKFCVMEFGLNFTIAITFSAIDAWSR